MARAWALIQERDYVTADDVDTLFLTVIGHRIVFAPAFVAEHRSEGREGALLSFRQRVFEEVPRPEPSDERELQVLSGSRS
jgi:MoxR-like ATPase